MIGLISCVKSKANKRCEAKDMYISPLFKYMYAYVKKRCKEALAYAGIDDPTEYED